MKKNKAIFYFIFYYLPVFLWMGLIFYFSSLQGNGIKWEPNFWFYAERKGAHIFEYFVLTFLIARAFFAGEKIESTRPDLKDKNFLKIILAGAVSLLYAFSDEMHQAFVFGREGKISDIGIDLAGILIAIFIVIRFRKNKFFKTIFYVK
ncbi:MAG: VanZ family protein [Candidatus Moranbacteria bacterium]|jgi:VanZ family protein|nr:VanZ family protein [Candidatus Moranbacteria bacterium]MDX9855958.1 VanZ family protein [Candidatus Moranbacteria bacterium]